MNAHRSIRGRWCSMAILIAFAAALLVCGTASAANVTTSAGNTTYVIGGDVSVIVDPSITVSDLDATLSATVKIYSGSQPGDALSGGGGNWDSGTRSLTIDNAANGSDMQSKLRLVNFTTTDISSSDRTITITVSGDLDSSYYAGTGHYYEFVPNGTDPANWSAAESAAESKSYAGLGGYLATITSSEERDFIALEILNDNGGWIGASDSDDEGKWCWVTGPEDGTQFWEGGVNGTDMGYANWNDDEPNNNSNEDYASAWAAGWGDLNGSAVYYVTGYVVEYGGPGFGGNANDSDTKTIVVTNPPNVPSSPQCEEQTNPTDVADPTPEFSWTFEDPDGSPIGSDTQGAYQIIVGTSAGSSDMWTSSKVSSSSSNVPYNGLALAPDTTYHWKVKTWDNYDAEGPYCADQTFTTSGPKLTLGNLNIASGDWGKNFSVNHSVMVTNTASNVNVTYNVSWVKGCTFGTVGRNATEWHNQSIKNSTVQTITVIVDATTTTGSAMNDSETFSINVTRREIIITADPIASQSVDPTAAFWINGSAEGEYAETFTGKACLIRNGSIIANKIVTGGNANFSRTEPTEGTFDFSIKFYNLTYYNNNTTNNAIMHIVAAPPASITGLDNWAEQSRIHWTWTDPTDADFAKVMIYLNGKFKTNVLKGACSYTATGLNPDTNYTIGTRTVDIRGNINQTWQNDTARTLPKLQRINVTPTASTTLDINKSMDFNATGFADQNESIDNLVCRWYTTPEGVGTLNNPIGSVVNFTARHAGRTEIYAVNSGVSSNKVWITVNSRPVTENVTKGTGNATSGDSTATVRLNNTSVSGNITIRELGDPLNSATANGSAAGLGTVKLIKGVNITASGDVTDALTNDTNHTSWIHIKIEYNGSQLGNIDENTLYIYKFVNGTGWTKLVKGDPTYCIANGRNTTAKYVWVDVTYLCYFGLGGSVPASSSSGSSGGSGGGGIYPPGWFETPTPAVTATKAPTGTTTDAPPGDKVTPRPTKQTTSLKTTTPTAEDTTAGKPANGAPGFTAVFVIAGTLAIAYAMMRRRE